MRGGRRTLPGQPSAYGLLLAVLLGVLLATAVAMTRSANAATGSIASAKCSARLLFKAAVKKERFNPKDPSYAGFGKLGNNPGAYDKTCYHGWAVAVISRPNVGVTDGGTLFKASRNTWVEKTTLGASIAECNMLRAHVGVPIGVALVLSHGVVHSGEAGC